MADTLRGAHLVVDTLATAGFDRIFTLSGNQIMPIFDACIDADIDLIHVRHEAAAVHMADAWGRLTGRPGVAMVTAGPGMANILSALYVALMAESPLVVLSGHAPLGQLERGAFQTMAQAEMAGHVTKASWTVTEADQLGAEIARALNLARSARPGPVYLSLPFDLLQASVAKQHAPPSQPSQPPAGPPDDSTAEQILAELQRAKRPLVLAGPAMMRDASQQSLSNLSEVTRLPVIGMESPRGVNDPSLGAFAEVLPEADVIVLLGKKLDFTLQVSSEPAFHADCTLLQVDADAKVLDLTGRLLNDPSRLVLRAEADPTLLAERLIELAKQKTWPASSWRDEVQTAISYRPAEWEKMNSTTDQSPHAVEVCRAVREFLAHDEQAVFISDGGEFGQWAQAIVRAPMRVINGPSGSIGSAIPFALAARSARPDSRIVAMLGDGTFGFHAMEFDTAVRHALPFIAVVGNDATWNAEYQIQLRQYGPERTVACELLPTRYDQVVQAMGGHGQAVTAASQLPAALNQAWNSRQPACVNVDIQRQAAPVIRRPH